MKHCFHATGFALRSGAYEERTERCCFCGNEMRVAWQDFPAQEEGHGDFAPKISRWQRILHVFDDEACPSRGKAE